MTDARNLQDPTAVIPGRVPPSDLDAEGNILGQCLLVPGDIDLALGWGLEPKHFYAGANLRIFEAMLAVHADASTEVHIIAVAAELRNRGRLDGIGGTPYLAQLSDTHPVNSDKQLKLHVRIIVDHWRARQAIAVQQTAVAALYQPHTGEPLQHTLEGIEQQIWEVTHQQREASYFNVGELARASLQEMSALIASGQSVLGITTGYPDLDAVTTGYHPGDLVVIAARPGVGKSALIMSSLLRATRVPKDDSLPEAAYLHSLEMPKEQVALRIVCSQAGVEFTKIRLNKLQRIDWEKLFEACRVVAAQPIYVDDRPAITVAELRSNIRKIKREIENGRIKAKRLRLCAVDYLQLMQGEKGGGREQEVSSLTRGLKAIAKTEEVCMIALAQLNRGVEHRGGKGPDKQKEPELQDLRESGAIEQDADTIIFLIRPKYYDKDAGDELKLKVAKNRNGPTCTVEVAFEGETMTVKPLAKGYEEFDDYGDAPAPVAYFTAGDDREPQPEDWRDK